MRDAALEFLAFGLKQVRACTFVGLFFAAVFSLPRAGAFGIPRYDLLLLYAVIVQAAMVLAKLETFDELKAICLFHAVGFLLEVFKTSHTVASWNYPDPGYTKLFGVPLFSGFMYAAVGSYVIQAWRLFELRVRHHPPYWMAWLIAFAIYGNFFTHHYIGDFRWYIVACALGLYARTTVTYIPLTGNAVCPCCCPSCSSVSSSGWRKISARFSASGAIPIRSARGPRFTSANGVPGHCSSS